MRKELETQLNLVSKYLDSCEDILSGYLFGSYVKQKENKYSDIDIAILFTADVTEKDWTSRQIVVMNDLSRLLNKQVDIIVLNRAPLFLKFQIIRTGKKIYERDRRESRFFEARSIVEYFDFMPLKHSLESAIIRKIKEA